MIRHLPGCGGLWCFISHIDHVICLFRIRQLANATIQKPSTVPKPVTCTYIVTRVEWHGKYDQAHLHCQDQPTAAASSVWCYSSICYQSNHPCHRYFREEGNRIWMVQIYVRSQPYVFWFCRKFSSVTATVHFPLLTRTDDSLYKLPCNFKQWN